MWLKHSLLYFIFVLISCDIVGQEIIEGNSDSVRINYKKNSIYIEVGGHGGLYSIAYDRIIGIKQNRKNTFSAGLSYFHGNF